MRPRQNGVMRRAMAWTRLCLSAQQNSPYTSRITAMASAKGIGRMKGAFSGSQVRNAGS